MSPQLPATQRLFLLWSTSPAGPPVDVGMRIDVASIDMVSEVNMVSGLPQGLSGRPSLRRYEMNLFPVLCFSLVVTSALVPRVPTPRVRPTPVHTTSVAPQFVFWTHTGYRSAPKEMYSALFWEGRGTVAPLDWLGRSLSLTLAGSP